MSWEFASPLDAGQRAALASGNAIVHVCPPAGWTLVPIGAALPAPAPDTLGLLIVASDALAAADIASAIDTVPQLRPVHVASGLARTDRVLRSAGARTLIGSAPDLLELTRRAALKLEHLPHLLVAWPEAHLALHRHEALDTLLSEARGAGRVIATTDEEAIREFLDRHAHRAPLGVTARPPVTPIGPARYAVVPRALREVALRQALDQLNPVDAVLWEPLPERLKRWDAAARAADVRVTSNLGNVRAALAVALDLPTPDAFVALRAITGDVLVLLEAHQWSTFQRLAAPVRPLHLVGESDVARDRAVRRRRAVRERLERDALDGELLALAPLFDEYDPALVAAAALALSDVTTAAPAETAAGEEVPGWARVHVDVGRRDRVRPADLVGALLNSVGLAKDHVGRVDIRDAFTLVEVRADDAMAAIRGLTGLRLRGRTVAARLDRR